MLSRPWICALALLVPGLGMATEAESGAAQAGEVVAGERGADGVWAWVDRLDGEVPAPEVEAAIAEQLEEDLSERALRSEDFGLDVPGDFYRNPERALLGDPLFLDKIDPSEFSIPVVVNPEVERWMRILLGPSRKYFQRWLERKPKFEALIYKEMDAAGLPRDLIYLSMIESGFNPNAYSHAAAAGLWQFIQATGRMYGLQVDFWVDERRDPEMATKAAAKMLGDLHRRFGDWYLSFAAYNTGPARVARNVDRLEAENAKADFWTMLERDMLHPETSGYVPKIVAAAIIGKHPERYGFTNLKPEPPLAYDTVVLDHAVDLEVLAECAGVDAEVLRGLNPALRRYAIPEGGFDVRLPPGSLVAFQEAYNKVPPEERRRIVMHAVRKGESLSAIATKYGVSMAAVASANGLKNVNQISVGQQLVIPMSGGASRSTEPEAQVAVRRVEREAAPAAPAPAPAPAEKASSRPATYTVRAGDALSVIAERHGLSLAEVMRLNGLRNANEIQVGQVLKLGGSAAASAVAEAPAAKATRYTVKSGDTLSGIAERFGVSMSALQSANAIRRASDIQVGQVLQIAGGTAAPASADAAPAFVTHTVRSGESLGIIAERYRVSVADLKSWNGLKSSTIYAGDKLKIRKR